MMPPVLVDTDVLVWVTRGHTAAEQHLSSLRCWHISAVTHMELMQGCRNRKEQVKIKKGLHIARADIIPIGEDISWSAMRLIELYALSHALRVSDALIAATALVHGLTILTANLKHFSPLRGLKLMPIYP